MFELGPDTLVIDVTAPLTTGVAGWPGDAAVELSATSRISDGAPCNVSRLTCSTHSGTHVDAPWHFCEDGVRLDDIPPERWIGPCHVIATPPGHSRITAEDLNRSAIPPSTTRLIIRTAAKPANLDEPFNPGYTALAPDAARWLLMNGIALIGIDTPSVEPFDDADHEVHRLLLGAGMLIVEGLDLSEVNPGPYLLICLPLRVLNADGAPARALLIKDPR